MDENMGVESGFKVASGVIYRCNRLVGSFNNRFRAMESLEK